MDITQKLQDFAFTFDTPLELTISGFDYEAEALEEFYDEWNWNFTGDQEDLYEVAFALMEIADEHFESERRESEREQELDERRYEGSRHIS